jgi:hypothetical protein
MAEILPKRRKTPIDQSVCGAPYHKFGIWPCVVVKLCGDLVEVCFLDRNVPEKIQNSEVNNV